MKAQFLVLLVLLSGLPPTVLAQAPDPGIPDPTDPPGPDDLPGADDLPDQDDVPDEDDLPDEDDVVDTSEVNGGTFLNEAFVPIQRFRCPIAPFTNETLTGETTWTRGDHDEANDHCVAQWGQGTYSAGSEAVLTSPGLPTDHLAASAQLGHAANDLFQALLNNGLNPGVAAGLIGGMATGCRNNYIAVPDLPEAAKGTCEQLLTSGALLLDVPELRQGTGNVYLDLRHAYDFSDTDANRVALDGGWVEIKRPGADWTRLDPQALFAPQRAGTSTLCIVTSPSSVFLNEFYRSPQATPVRDALENDGGIRINDFRIPLNPGESLPANQREWEEDCSGLTRSVYGLNDAFAIFTPDPTEGSATDPATWGTTAFTMPGQRLDPYPGVIRGEGPGFVGDTRDFNDDLQFVEHWFDLSPYAGETVQVRFHATGGPGAGLRQGGWWVDDVNVRYAGPPHDLGLRINHPAEGDSFPAGEVPVEVQITNLGRTASQPVQVTASLAGANQTLTFPALDPLQRATRTTTLPTPASGTHQVSAAITATLPEQSPEPAPYGDTFPPNDQSVRSITIEDLTDVSLQVQGIEVGENVATFSVAVHNGGNQPVTVPLQAELTAVDQVTRLPRVTQSTSVGEVAQVTVPHGRKANSLGVDDPVRTVEVNITLPDLGVWRATFTTPEDASARAMGFAAYGEAAPPAIEETFASVSPGGIEDIPRGAFELRGDGPNDDRTVLTVDPRHPLGGPQTRYVPHGDYALSAAGGELESNYTTVHYDVPSTLRSFGQDGAQVGLPEEVRLPVTAQAWHVREHHTTIYGVGTTDESDAQYGGHINKEVLEDLDPKKGEKVLLEFSHAAQVNWTNGAGSEARVLIVPQSSIDLEKEMAAAENASRQITAQLPPEVRPVVETTLQGLFFDGLAHTTVGFLKGQGLHRFPEGICQGPIQNLLAGAGGLEIPVCGDPRLVSQFNGPCPVVGDLGVDCDLTDEDLAYYTEFNGQTREDVRTYAWSFPAGWENVTIDVTDLMDNDEAFYVVFDLVTTSEFEDVMASARAGGHPEGSNYTAELSTIDQSTQSEDELTAGWARDKQPLWTVDNARVSRYQGNDALVTYALCDLPTLDECLDAENTLPRLSNRGWHSQAAPPRTVLHWSYDALGGDPRSLDPGALIWRGGNGAEDDNGRALFEQEDPGNYSILRTEAVDLSGYEKPTLKMHVAFGRTDVFGGDLVRRCEAAATDEESTVWTRVGWNVRVRPMTPDGSPATKAETVEPLSGYDDCSEVPGGSAPILFNATAQVQTPGTLTGTLPGTSIDLGRTFHASCGADGKVDPLEMCREARIAFGHEQPVFALPLPWTDVEMDLSQYKGQRVLIEVHAYGINGATTASCRIDADGCGRGELKLDTFTVAEGNPPVDLTVSHEKRPAIAPGTEERFDVEVTNTGREVISQVSIRRSIIGPDGCQYDEAPPVVVSAGLSDPTGQANGLPAGETTVVRDKRLAWDAPSEQRQLFERRITVDPRADMPLSDRPFFLIEPPSDGRSAVTILDNDDCPEDLEVAAEALGGDPDITQDETSVSIQGGQRSDMVRVTATDKAGVESLPLYLAPPPGGRELNSTTTAKVRVLQSHPDSLVRIAPQVGDDVVEQWILVVPGPDGNQIFYDEETTVLQDLPPGEYYGYILFDVGTYDIVRFTVEPLPAPGSDATPADNLVNIRGQTRALPRLAIGDVSLPEQVRLNKEFQLPITIANTGNVPLHNVTTEVTVEPAQVTASVKVLRLAPGEVRKTNIDLRISDPGSQRVSIEAQADEGVGATAGDLVRVMRAQDLVPEPGEHEGWNGTIFGDGVRVHPLSNASLPLDGRMDLSSAPLSSLYLNHTGELEESYDGVKVEWRTDEGILDQGLETVEKADLESLEFIRRAIFEGDPEEGLIRLELSEDNRELSPTLRDRLEQSGVKVVNHAPASGGTPALVTVSLPSVRTLTTSHADAAVGDAPDAVTGRIDQPLTASSTHIEGAKARMVDRVEPEEWEGLGSFRLDVDESALDDGRAYWLPTAPMVEHEESALRNGVIRHELRVPLTEEDWCVIQNDLVPSRTPLRIQTTERRLFSEPSAATRGWTATVQLQTGQLYTPGSTAAPEEPKVAQAEPIVPLPDDEMTGWESVEYQVQISSIVSAIERGLIPFRFTGSGDPCADASDEDLTDGAAFVFILETATTTARRVDGGLDVGWFLGNVGVPTLDLQAGAGRTVTQGCLDSQSHFSEAVVSGCTAVETGDQVTRLDMNASAPGQYTHNHEGRIQVVELSSDSAAVVPDNPNSPGPDGTGVLDDLLNPRPMTVLEHRVTTADPDEPARDRFTYADATTLLDLRSGTEGVLVLDLDTQMVSRGLVQVAATPVPPGEADNEEVGHRVPWTTLPLLTAEQAYERLLDTRLDEALSDAEARDRDLPVLACEPEAQSTPLPQTPLGSSPDAVVGAPMGPHQVLDQGTEDLCVDLTPIAGQMALVTLRVWVPGPHDPSGTQNKVDIVDGEAWLRVAQPRVLRPQVRALTDDTVNEGSYILHDAAILSLAPRFSHAVQAELADTVDVDGKPTLIANGIPDLGIEVVEPGLPARWEMGVWVLVEWEHQDGSGTTNATGEVDLDEDEFEGPQQITIPWKDLRAAPTQNDEEIPWLANAPALPHNITRLEVWVTTTPVELLQSADGCPSDFEELQVSQDLACRRLADLVASDDGTTLRFDGPQGAKARVADLRIEPDRGIAGTPRTAVVQLENPTTSPVELKGNLTLLSVDPEDEQTELARTPFPPTLVRPGQNRTVTVPLPIPDDEPGTQNGFSAYNPSQPRRVLVKAEIGDTSVVDDYRTFPGHASGAIMEEFFQMSGPRVTRGADWAKPALPGEPSDGLGFQLTTAGGSSVSTLTTNFVDVDVLRELLRDEDGQPVFTFYHQRQLSKGDNLERGEFSFAAVTLSTDGDPIRGFAPNRSVQRPATTDAQGTDFCAQGGGTGGGTATDVAGAGQQVFMGTVGSMNPDVVADWVPVVIPIPVDRLPQSGFIRFNIHLADCADPPSEGAMIVDQFSFGSGAPLVQVGEEEVPIQPGTTKRYRFSVENKGLGSDSFHVVPGAPVPEGWKVQVALDDGTLLFDSATETLEPVELHEGQRLEGIWRVSVPSGLAAGIQRTLPLTAYATEAPSIASSGSFRYLLADGEAPPGVDLTEDPGLVNFVTTGTPQPDLQIEQDSITIDNAEVGRQPTIRFRVFNRGTVDAQGVPVRAAIDGPSGFQELASAQGGPVVEDFQATTGKWLTFVWTDPSPRAPGIHTLRAVVDPGEAAQSLLLSDTPTDFTGLTQESEECDTDNACLNLATQRFEVQPRQQPELSLRIEGVPDRIATGSDTRLTVIVTNHGGQTATGATLTLSENGLLPILDSLSVELDDIAPGDQIVLRPSWTPVTPGDILLLASVEAPDEFTGQRADGSRAGDDNDRALPVTVEQAGISLKLDGPLRVSPGRPALVNATLENTGTAPLQVLPEANRHRGVVLTPLVDTALAVAPGEVQNLTLLAFADVGTTPRTAGLPLPMDKGMREVKVHVLAAPAFDVVLERTPLEPGNGTLRARVSNLGNVPLAGTLELRGEGVHATHTIELDRGASENLTLEVSVTPGTPPGARPAQVLLHTDDGELRTGHRIEIASAPAAAIAMDRGQDSLGGSAMATVTVTNVGNQPLTGRLVLEGGAELLDAPALELTPGASAERSVSWVNAAERNATARVVDLEGDTLGKAPLELRPRTDGLELVGVSTRPSVNLRQGMAVQVQAVAENTGAEALRNVTLGVTIDGELYQTFVLDDLEAGETTIQSTNIELPRGGTVTLGVVDLDAFRRGEVAGPATNLEVEGSGLVFDQVAAVPAVPWAMLLLLWAVLAAGVKRE